MNMKLTFPQILLAAAVVATVMTVADLFIDWEKRIYAGIFAFILTVIVFNVAERIFSR